MGDFDREKAKPAGAPRYGKGIKPSSVGMPNFRAQIDMRVPEDALTTNDLKAMIAETPDAGPDNRISLKGKTIACNLHSLGKENVKKLDFSGANLNWAQLGSAFDLKDNAFLFDNTTIFAREAFDAELLAEVQHKMQFKLKFAKASRPATRNAEIDLS